VVLEECAKLQRLFLYGLIILINEAP